MFTMWSETPDSEAMPFEVGSFGLAWTRSRVMRNADGTWSSTVGGHDGDEPTSVTLLDQLHDLIGYLMWQARDTRGVVVVESPSRRESYLFPAERWPALRIESSDEGERLRDDLRPIV